MGDCFKAMVGLRNGKEDRSKQKVHSATRKSIWSRWRRRSRTYSHRLSQSAQNSPSDLHLPVEVLAAVHIQTAFRAFVARKALHRLKGTAKIQVSIEKHAARYKAVDALSYIHSWSRIQSDIRARRLCMVKEGRIKQKKQDSQSKLETKLHDLEVEWCGGSETMEEILSRIQQREEAAVKRERAMAYAFSHQWRANSSQYLGQTYYNVGKDNWGWSWTERWIAARPWEVRVHASLPAKLKKVQNQQATKPGKNPDQIAIILPVVPNSGLSNGKVVNAESDTNPKPETEAT